MHHARGLKHGKAVIQRESRKTVAGKEWELNFLLSILPLTQSLDCREKLLNVPGRQLASNNFFIARTSLQRKPATPPIPLAIGMCYFLHRSELRPFSPTPHGTLLCGDAYVAEGRRVLLWDVCAFLIKFHVRSFRHNRTITGTSVLRSYS